jgi:hypothetical protein
MKKVEFSEPPSFQITAKLLIDLCLPRACGRPVTLTETLAAAAITPFDKTRCEIVAPAITANQLVGFLHTTDLLPERWCRVGLARFSFLAERPLTGQACCVHLILGGRRGASAR